MAKGAATRKTLAVLLAVVVAPSVVIAASGEPHMTGAVEDASDLFAEWIGRSEYREGELGLVSIAGLENAFG